jgi:PhzF family phenazine biosynthesis protein
MIQKVFLVDALVDGPFSGSPTTVLYLTDPLERFKMASLAAEFGTSESVFVLPHEEAYLLRFFTPLMEIKLGVHACQAAAHIIYEMGLCPPTAVLTFLTQEGEVTARHFAQDVTSIELDTDLYKDLDKDDIERYAPLLGVTPGDVEWGILTSGRKVILAIGDYNLLKRVEPNLAEILNARLNGIAATVQAKQNGDCDYYLRSFRPNKENSEDHVSGSLNRVLAPYWSKILQKKDLVTRQLSKRGGLLHVDLSKNDKVTMKGRATTVLRADVILESLSKSFI